MFKNYILPFANMVTLGRGGGANPPPVGFMPFTQKTPTCKFVTFPKF